MRVFEKNKCGIYTAIIANGSMWIAHCYFLSSPNYRRTLSRFPETCLWTIDCLDFGKLMKSIDEYWFITSYVGWQWQSAQPKMLIQFNLHLANFG